jgi:hypothetical protein
MWRAISARPIARHVIQRIVNPRPLASMASHDVASDVCQALIEDTMKAFRYQPPAVGGVGQVDRPGTGAGGSGVVGRTWTGTGGNGTARPAQGGLVQVETSGFHSSTVQLTRAFSVS